VRIPIEMQMSRGPSRSLVIFLHGSGGNGGELRQFLSVVPLGEKQGYRPFVDVLGSQNMDLLTPTAVSRAYTPFDEAPSTVWFNRAADFLSKGAEDVYEDVEGANKSFDQVNQLIEENQDRYDHFFLGGISMGGCLSLHGLRRQGLLNPKVRGIFSMGSFLVNNSIVFKDLSTWHSSLPNGDGVSGVPVLMMHGTCDSMIRHDWGKTTATNMLLRGVNVRFESYDNLDHEIGEGELVDLLAWMSDLRYTADKVAKRPEQERQDPLASEWANVEAASKFQEPLGEVSSGVASGVPFIIEKAPANNSSSGFVIRFPVPEDIAPQLIPLLIASPVLACGGVFNLVNDPTRPGVMTLVQTSEPENLAKAIAARIAIRVTSGGASLSACPMS